MEKRRRGRPRKTESQIVAPQERSNVSNAKIIPPDFIDKFGGNIPRTCTLKIPSGLSWQVGMTRTNDSWFFQNGWPEFVEENSVEVHDVLTFCLVGKSTFTVKMFSPNGCIKRGGADDTSKSHESCESEEEDSEINGRRSMRRIMDSRG